MVIRRLLVFSLIALLAACSSRDSFRASTQVLPTDPTVTERNPMIIRPTTPGAGERHEITPSGGATPIQIGYLSAEETRVEKEGSLMRLSTRVALKDTDSRVRHSRQVELSGSVSADGKAVLMPVGGDGSGEFPVRARVTCISLANPADCDNAIIDLYMKDDNRIHAIQLEAALDQNKDSEAQPPKKSRAPKKKSAGETQTPAPERSAPTDTDKTPKRGEDAPVPTTPRKQDQPQTPKQLPPVVTQTPPPRPPVESEEEEEDVGEGVDPEDRPSFYIGTLYEGADGLFKNIPSPAPAPAPHDKKPDEDGKGDENHPTPPRRAPTPNPTPAPEPAPPLKQKKVHDQAVGSANKGFLENATDMKERGEKNASQSSTLLVAEQRSRYFGTYEMVELIDYMGRYARKSSAIGVLRIGDLSQKSGGRLGNSKHVSHQNGLDADLGYPMKDLSRRNEPFRALVSKGQLDPDLDVKATWALLKAAWSTKAVDRIFVDQHIKKALCAVARQNGDIDAEGEGRSKQLLRLIRPWPGHHTHFHLRIRCSYEQPRCRMMGEPRNVDSGC